MKTLTPIVLLLAGCAPTPRSDDATVTLFGTELRLETWKAAAVERGHVHPGLIDGSCPMSLLLGMSEVLKGGLEERHPGVLEKQEQVVAGMMEQLCIGQYGKAYGGAERLVLVLRPPLSGQELPDEALFIDLPRLKPGEKERLFGAGEFVAARERPTRTVDATLERGWARVMRLSPLEGEHGARYEFEVFLVLKPIRPDSPDDRVQVISRMEASTR